MPVGPLSGQVLVVRPRFGPILRRYGAGIATDVLKLTFFVLLGAQALFLSNVVVADLLPEIMEHQAGMANLAALIVLTVPGVMVIALPLAILVGSYLIVVNRRQLNEFATLANVGFSSRSILQLAACIGLGSLLVSHVLSGYAEPLARYQLAKTFFSIESDAVRDGRIAAGRFNEVGDYVVFAAEGQFSGSARGLFVHERINDETYRIITAARSQRVRDNERDGLGLILGEAAVYQFENEVSVDAAPSEHPSCVGCEQETVQVALSNHMYVQFREANAPTLRVRGSQISDWTTYELLRYAGHAPDTSVTFAERLLRDLLCLFAPFVALLAATLTTNRTYLFALPLAGGLVLGVQFLGTYAAKSFASVGLTGTFASMALLGSVCAIVLLATIRRYETGLIQPLDMRL